jgi:hypothetical protein
LHRLEHAVFVDSFDGQGHVWFSGAREEARPLIVQKMQHWLADPDFAGVRGEVGLAKMPEAERKAWRQLWADVENTLAKARGTTAPQEKSNKKP